MKKLALNFWILIVLMSLIFGGCYTQLKLEDDDYTYRKEYRKKVEIKDEESRSYDADTVYESTDDQVYEEEEETYYYPRHRRAYKYYYPGITIVVGGGVVYYDPWYFDYFYYPYVYCRPFFYPIWYWGYYPCHRAWYWVTFYDPFYNPYYYPPYWWYDPYWWSRGYYYPYYRKNDFTRLRDNDGGRSGIRTADGNFRNLNPNVSVVRSRLRDIEEGRVSTSTRNRDREIYPRERENLRTPSATERSPGLDRERTGTSKETTSPVSTRDRRDDRQSPTEKGTIRDRAPQRSPDRNNNPTPSIERKPERNPDRQSTPPPPSIERRPERNPDRQSTPPPPSIERRPERNPDRKENPSPNQNRPSNIAPEKNPDRRESAPVRRFDSNVPAIERDVKIERRINDKSGRNYDNPQSRLEERKSRIQDFPKIDYDVYPRETFVPKVEKSRKSSDSKLREDEYRRETPSRRSETPRYIPSTPPSYDPPVRRESPSFNPPVSTPAPSRSNPAPSTDRRRD